MAQFSGDENQETLQGSGNGSQPTYVFYSYIILAAVNIALSITASIGNILILVALHEESSLHPPSKLLFRCLAVTDLCVGLITQPCFAAYVINMAAEGSRVWDLTSPITILLNATSLMLCGVSLCILTTIRVDRLLALLLQLRYREVVTLRRLRVVVAFICLVNIVDSVLSLLNYTYMVFYYVGGMIVLCLIVSTVCYMKIYAIIRHQQAQVQNLFNQGQPNGNIPLSIARYKKTVSSALCVHLSLVACYLPYFVAILFFIGEPSLALYIVLMVTSSFLFLNSSLNPVLYCWRIRELRQAVKGTVRQLWCF